MPVLEPSTLSRRRLAELLAEARARTILLVSPLSEENLHDQPDGAVNPVLQELEKIVRFEQEWLAGSATDFSIGSYDEWFDTMLQVREVSLERLESVDDRESQPVEHRCRLVLEHEYRRGEAILETVQLQPDYRAPRRTALPRGRRLADPGFMARFPGGMVPIGVPPDTPAWPDEQPADHVELSPFWIDAMPVTNGDFITFMAAGGYMTADFWSDSGWEWVRANQVRMPRHWFWDEGAWWTRWMDRASPLDLTCPVGCISWYEAEAFARFVGKRLPTELEWEAAASWDPETGSRRLFPWGSMPPSVNVANLDQLAFQTAEVGAFPGNLSPIGCYGMIGDLWEWTAIQPAASTPDMSARKVEPKPQSAVLRGGSWATRQGSARVTARRCAPPSARHLFSGFRCAHDV